MTRPAAGSDAVLQATRPDPARRSGRHVATPPDTPGRVLTGVALLVMVGVGTAIRARGLTSLGLFRDDAWAAMSSRVGIGTAWHMWVTAPAFYFLERSFIGLHPGVTWWAQIPPLVAGIAAIPAMYLLARHFGFRRVVGLVLALLVCVSPVCVTYSTHLKEYGAVFLMTCAVLWVAETARYRPDRLRFVVLAAVSVVAFVVSASMGPVIAGVWIAVVLCAARERRLGRDEVVSAVVVVGACGIVAAVFYRRISPSLSKFWGDNFISHGSVAAFGRSLNSGLWGLYLNLLRLPALTGAVQVLVLLVLVGFSVIGASRNAAMLGPACIVVVAMCASAAHVTPLGTGRTDEYLYPALLLLLASGVVSVWAGLRDLVSPEWRGRAGLVVAAAGVIVGASLIDMANSAFVPYPGFAVQTLATELSRAAEPTDHIVIGELARYQWAYYEDDPLRLRFGPDWSTYFTVVSTDPRVFIVPSEGYEGGSDPARWANELRRYDRVWFVECPPLSVNPTYAALLADGWHPEQTLNVTGGAAILLVRSPS